MEKTLEQRADLASLTKKEKLILDYLIRHRDSVCLMTSNEIAAVLEIGTSSVVRLAGKLGYKNYTAMRKALQVEALQSGISKRDELIPYEKMDGSRHLSDQELLAAYTNKVLHHIGEDATPRTEEKLSEVANAILSAKRVFIVGFRACAGFASSFVTMLSGCRPDVYAVGQDKSTVDQLISVTERDLLIAVSFSRYSKDTLFAVQMAKELTCPIVVMTDSYTAPLAEYADMIVISSTENFSFFNAYTSFVMNMEKIVLLVGHRSMDQTQERLRRMERYLEKTNQY